MPTAASPSRTSARLRSHDLVAQDDAGGARCKVVGTAKTWLSVGVELLSGRGEDLWPRPGRVFIVGRGTPSPTSRLPLTARSAVGTGPICVPSRWRQARSSVGRIPTPTRRSPDL